MEIAATVALLSSEPAATVATRTAGVVEFSASFSWRGTTEMPDGPLIPELPGCDSGGVRATLLEAADARQATRQATRQAVRRVCGEILALTQRDLGVALDAALRAVGDVAALTEAVLETRAIRRAEPREVPVHLREQLGKELSEEGFKVCFAPAWTATSGADLVLGAEGMRRELEEFLARNPAWRISASSP